MAAKLIMLCDRFRSSPVRTARCRRSRAAFVHPSIDLAPKVIGDRARFRGFAISVDHIPSRARLSSRRRPAVRGICQRTQVPAPRRPPSLSALLPSCQRYCRATIHPSKSRQTLLRRHRRPRLPADGSAIPLAELKQRPISGTRVPESHSNIIRMKYTKWQRPHPS